ncbi:uncharacterized protein EDB91DRAFT_1090354 [Suillus paluster]|uniref:uncharacterized protein n=1 Tax=Suillus paluster TaxID=48578 RepID=UPI001B884B99|nr:uncharacterized protein EDB91DRAFT_1090354 [Suillus paluster]KAG1718053.1 hypothetical protein EDB91DRAFT_1090354 [Suillus paluster]
MSSRPSITSYTYRAKGTRRLPPMSSGHPKLRQLKRSTSLEWVYDAALEDTDAGPTDGRLVIRVGEDVAIFPLEERSVPMMDGSLPIMSYWYGKIKDIYWKTTSHNQEAWLDIQWYYRQVDLEDEGIDLADCVGTYELVLSDHTSIVDMHCVETHATILRYDEGDLSQPQIPTETLYHRWTMNMHFVNRGNTVYLDGVNICPRFIPMRYTELTTIHTNVQRFCRTCDRWFNEICLVSNGRRMHKKTKVLLPSLCDGITFDKEFLALMTMPIRRGGPCGVVGNALIVAKIRTLITEAIKRGSLPDGWKEDIHKAGLTLTSSDKLIPRFYCLVCPEKVV